MWKLAFLSLLAGVEPGSPEAGSFSAGASAAHDEYINSRLPLVVNTWTGDFGKATERAWAVISSDEGKESTVLDAVEQGCNECEDIQCGGSVGYGGHPDSSGEVTLDSMVMYGPRHSVGAVACIRRIKNAATVARAVMEHTEHTMLAGEGATSFAKMLGMQEEDLGTDASRRAHESWTSDKCQPNYYRGFDDAAESCPPYPPPSSLDSSRITDTASVGSLRQIGGSTTNAGSIQGTSASSTEISQDVARLQISEDNHDTIGMVVVDKNGDVACGTTTNGAANKIAGRVGDSPVAGAGCYVDNDVGGAAATGDGDIMMRFLPSFRAVESMRAGATPQEACAEALCRIAKFYPTYGGALVCANTAGEHGAARHGLSFSYTYRGAGDEEAQTAHAIEADEEYCRRVAGEGMVNRREYFQDRSRDARHFGEDR